MTAVDTKQPDSTPKYPTRERPVVGQDGRSEGQNLALGKVPFVVKAAVRLIPIRLWLYPRAGVWPKRLEIVYP